MKRLFGTDGIRGPAGRPPLDPPTVRTFGWALCEVLGHSKARPVRVVLGRDTRESGPWLRDAVAEGVIAHGGSAVDAGVITTPGLAMSTRGGLFDAGVMISASHNPYEDNGLKVFGRDGMKLADALEAEIESLMLDTGAADPRAAGARATEDGSLLVRYVGFLDSVVPAGRFEGLRLLLDCANGSASGIAGDVFRRLGADVATIGDTPDGFNINRGCGSLHLGRLSANVREGRFDLGLAFDGDADRCLVVDRQGRVADGDHILYVTARKLARDGLLTGNAVVATVMSNFWLEQRLAEIGVRLIRAPVGDKYVLEEMIAADAALGGEQSGHIIFRDRATTGDGLLTGIVLVDALVDASETLESVLDGIVPCPQVLLNVRVSQKPELRTHPVIGPIVSEVEARLDGTGRVVLRYSGTEPLARVMIEGSDETEVKVLAEHLAEAIRSAIGA